MLKVSLCSWILKYKTWDFIFLIFDQVCNFKITSQPQNLVINRANNLFFLSNKYLLLWVWEIIYKNLRNIKGLKHHRLFMNFNQIFKLSLLIISVKLLWVTPLSSSLTEDKKRRGNEWGILFQISFCLDALWREVKHLHGHSAVRRKLPDTQELKEYK